MNRSDLLPSASSARRFALLGRLPRGRGKRHQRRAMAAVAASGMLALGAAGATAVQAQVAAPKPEPKVDLSKDHVLYLIGYSHLDTQWCWSYPQVIRQFIPDTLHQNFALFEKYPDYVFNWTGAKRYDFMKQYYPADYATLKKYVAEGRWFPNGSSLEEGDVNNPSSESLVRQVMYGNQFFKREFGKYGDDYMLPDCFGFPASLPTILAHAGVKGFSTQKLTWGSAVGIPFNVGVWTGPDGQGVLAALNCDSYTSQVGDDLSHDAGWIARVDDDGKKSGLFVDYHYYGKGDRGGSAGENSVPWVEKSVNGDGPLKVISGRADMMFNTITPEQAIHLPHYNGDLELTQHSAGSLTSEAEMKRWNRENEVLADAAEKASVASMVLGAQPYPMARITDAWWRFLPGQFHDLMAGTALPIAYTYTWNDEVIAMNEFAGALREGVGGVARGLDTRGKGVPVVVYNPLSIDRQDVVEATVALPGGAAGAVRVTGSNGETVPAQVVSRAGGKTRIAFLAHVPSVGFATFSVAPVGVSGASSELKVTKDTIENARYRVHLDAAGDIASIFDKKASKELLASPMRLAFQYENPSQYPAWNMDFADQSKPPKAYVDGPATVKIVENGPARVALQVTRSAQGSRFSQTIRLSAGAAGNRVEFVDNIDWKSQESALKQVFPLSVSNPMATYNWGFGTIQRDNNNPKRYEAASHQWFDLTDTSGKYGVTVLSGDRNGSDKPDDSTLRLTLLYTPGTRAGYQHQGTQDWGRHELVYGVEGHPGDWHVGDSQWEAARLSQPLVAFTAPAHAGSLGKSFSLAKVSDPNVQIEAMKRAEDSDEVIVRLNELSGTAQKGVRLSFAAPIVSAREVNGQEEPLPGSPTVTGGALVFNMEGYRPRAFALKLGKAPASLGAPKSTPVALAYDAAVTSSGAGKADGAFDDQGHALPGELLPPSIESDGIQFHFGATTAGAKNAVTCNGQSIKLPAGSTGRLYLIAAAYGGDAAATFKVGSAAAPLKIQDWSGYVGQWDTRLWGGEVPELTYDWHNPIVGLTPGFVKPASIAWYSDHWRLADGTNDPYRFCYLYRYAIDLPAGAASVTLPNNPKIRILAATVGHNPNDDTAPAEPLYDNLADHRADSAPMLVPNGGTFHDVTSVSVTTPLYYSTGGDLRYTTDGSEPTASSPAYTGPIPIDRPTTIRVRQLSPDGSLSPEAMAKFDVNDTTPPSVVRAAATDPSTVRVLFSEPVAKVSAEATSNYGLQPALPIKSATLAADGRSVDLALDGKLPDTGAETLTVNGVKDLSPAANATTGVIAPVRLLAAVFDSAPVRTFNGTGRGFTANNLNNLPVKASEHWTINLFVYTETTPDELTVIGGFGDGSDNSGTQRYLVKFHDGIHFWGSNVDISSGVPFDLGKWQMITITYDGATIRMYKNGVEIHHEDAVLSDAIPVVHAGIRGPWDNGHRFVGKIARFTIWDQALTPDYLKKLLLTSP